MKKKNALLIEIFLVTALIAISIFYRFVLYTPKDIFEKIDWVLRIVMVPFFWIAFSYAISKIIFSKIIIVADKKYSKVFLSVIGLLFLFYIIASLFTLVAYLSVQGFSMSYGTIFYEVIRLITVISGSRLQEGISVVFGMLVAFGVSSIQAS